MRRVVEMITLVLIVAGCADGEPESAATGGGSTLAGGFCDPADEDCVCGACRGFCAADCSTDYTTWVCHVPPEPGPDQFACGPWQTVCNTGEACVREVPPGDGCDTYSCAAVPDACAGDLSCACLAPFLDEQQLGACAGEVGAPTVEVLGPAADLPWDAPACGSATCSDGESCWDCLLEGGTPRTPVCSVEDPSTATGRCNLRWSAPEP